MTEKVSGSQCMILNHHCEEYDRYKWCLIHSGSRRLYQINISQILTDLLAKEKGLNLQSSLVTAEELFEVFTWLI